MPKQDGPSEDPSRRKPLPQKRKAAPNKPTSTSYKSVSLWCGRTRRFDTEEGGFLCVDTGEVALSFRLRRNADPREGEPIDTASCLLQLADDTGEVWEAASTFSLHVFVASMINLDRTSGLAFLDEVDEWKEAFANDRLLSEASSLYDDRFYRSFLVGDERIELQFKYQCPTFDVAFYRSLQVPSRTRLIVKVSGLYDVETNLIRPLAFEMNWGELLFRNELCFDHEEGWWAGDGWPLPLVFRRAGLSGTPQSLVRYEGESTKRV